MKKVRGLPNWLIIILWVLLLIGVAGVIIKVTFGAVYDKTTSDISTIQAGYEAKKNKCELLRTIADNVVEVGTGINLQAFLDEDIQYKIYNDDENIVIYYYIKEPSSSEHLYHATITLSNDYRILEEKYGIELEDFETYRRRTEMDEKIMAAFYTMMNLLCCILILCIAILVVLAVVNKVKKKQKPHP